MKTLAQIRRYVEYCSFPEQDWIRILEYCKQRFGSSRIHKTRIPGCASTYDQFIEWEESGIGVGDVVRYGSTVGLVGVSLPDRMKLIAYLDFEGRLVCEDMEVRDRERLNVLDGEQAESFYVRLINEGFCYNRQINLIEKVYTPKRYEFVCAIEDNGETSVTGMYLESEGYRHHLLAAVSNEKMDMDIWVECKYAPLKKMLVKNMKNYYDVVKRAGFTYNARTNRFIPAQKRQRNNVYYYLNDRFQVVQDLDNMEGKHNERYESGNYFLDYMCAVLFADKISEMARDQREQRTNPFPSDQ